MNANAIKPLVSVVIPVKNGAGTIRECLDGIFSQTIADKMQVIIIDSGSNDGTQQILDEYPVTIHRIYPDSFDHGDTRNLGARIAVGEYVVFTVQDALPSDPRWLETLVEHFKDPEVSGVCGQQIVHRHPLRNPLQWFRPAGPADIKKIKVPHFDALPADEKHQLCRWDNVNAAYRRSVLMEVPFRQTSFGEDSLWAKDALALGKTLVYDYSARVGHYHHQSFSFYFRRSYIIYYLDYRHFNYLEPGQHILSAVPRSIYRILRLPITLKQKVYWTNYNLNLVFAKFLAKMTFRLLIIMKGEDGIDLGLQVFCHQVPQGRQKIFNTQFS